MTTCHHLNKNRHTKENNSQGPQTEDTVEQKKTQEEGWARLSFYSVSGDEDMEASYSDFSLDRDSSEGGPES